MTDSALERRVEELEAQLAFLERLQSDLNDIVSRQDQEIVLLKAQVSRLAERLRNLGESAAAGAHDPAMEIPPHY